MGARPPPRLRATRSLPKSTGSGPGRGAGRGGWGEAGAGEAQPAALRHMILSLASASSPSRMWLSTPLSPWRGSGLFEFLTTWIESPLPARPTHPRGSQSSGRHNPRCGRGKGPGACEEEITGMAPLSISPIPSPLLSIIQGACSRNSPPVC